MEVKLLFLTGVLLSSVLLTQCEPLYVLMAPNLLRVGSSENIFVEAQDYTGDPLPVRISIKNFPAKTVEMARKTVTLTGEKFQILTDIMIPDDKNFFSDNLEKQYVYLQAEFPTVTLEKVIMVSFQSGYIFVQTDKPIYTPGSNVQYRIFAMTPNLKPLHETGIMVEIMNPQGITIKSDSMNTIKGMKTGIFNIPDLTSLGMWKVVARYTNTPQTTFTADFEIKEYVLPTFEVKLNPSESFYYVGGNQQDEDTSLTVDIEATYLFGKEVDGNAFVLFGVMHDEKKTTIPSSLQKVQVLNGKGIAELTRAMITTTFKDITKLVGQSIYVSVNVLTESGSEMVEAERRGIMIVTSPYTIHFHKTPQFFKPGMPLGVSVYVTNPDETPAENLEVEVEVDGRTVYGSTKANGIAKVKVNTLGESSTLKITAKTKDAQLLKSEQQAVKRMTAHAYKTTKDSKNYLHVNIESAEFEIGDQMTVNLNTGQSPGVKDQDYTYMILSKGQIIQADRFKRQGQSLVALSLTVTKEMVPSFRFVAYYHVGSDEVVSDSVWVDVKDTCMGKLKLEVKKPKHEESYKTGDEVNLHITGDPGARVGLVVVDKAVHVLNKNRLTQTQIWNVIEKHDTGCTGGGGKDSMGVFSDAGLMFESNTAGGTDTRTVSKCPVPAKRKRRSEIETVTTTLAGKYPDSVRQCCLDGMRNNRLGYTCERRATYIIDGPECVNAFLDCCNVVKSRKDTEEEEEEEMILARSDDEDGEYTDYNDITSRTQFPESWLWEEIDLCDKCSNPSKDKALYLKDSITTWQVLAISMSPSFGICVAEPEEIVVFKSFFIDLKVPYSAVRGEQLEIKAIIHNYTNRKLKKVRVEFLESDDVCSAASKKGKYRTLVDVEEKSSVAVSYVIIPLKLESNVIEVKASVLDYEDGVRKTLKVVSEGVFSKLRSQRLELNPAKNDGEERLILKAVVPQDQVPGTPVNTYITVTGEDISESIEQAINGSFMGKLIVQPGGCGEQNMASMTLPLIATHYLDSTNQWEYVGIERRKDAINHIKTGYEGQLSFRKKDGSYALWIHTDSSTWLTAYVAKVFAIANDLITIKEDVICSALKWLILYKQQPDGSFKEDKPVYQRDMMGGIEGRDADASLTAFVLIAMQEGKDICRGTVSSLYESMKKAVDFLKGQLQKLTSPYTVALTSYALANAGVLDKEILMRHSTQAGDSRFWNVPRYYHSIEATAYAVLALVKDKDFDKAGEAVRWLAKQKTSHGGYGTTQVTIMVFQAVAEYRKQVQEKTNFDLNVELSVPGRSSPARWTIQRSNIYHTRSENVDLNKDFTVTAKGTGSAILSVMTLYYARPIEKKSDCGLFDLSVKMDKIPETKAGAIESYNFTMDFFYKDEKTDASMTILDLSIPTGFDIEENDLQQLSEGKEKYIQKYEKNKVLSERGSLIIYLNKVSHKEFEKISFRMHKMLNVSLLQPAAVTIYEYYSPNARCTKYYHPERKDGALYRLCKGDLCQCAEENCSYQKKNKVDESVRLIKACEQNLDYVYKVKVVGMDLNHDSDIYHMKVEKTVKEGSDAEVEGKVKPFLARPSCRESLGLVEGKSYLIMGHSVDLPNLGGSLQYFLGEQTWVEYWPTTEESHNPEYRERFIGMSELLNLFTRSGCLT